MKSASAVTAARPGGPGHTLPDAGRQGRETVIDALRRRRDRLLADGRFQRFAAAFFLTRPVARARSRALFDLCAGFVLSLIHI